jgi:GNAT superfamily N-acetyltransferase
VQNLILDLDLAREVELAEAQAAVGCAEMMSMLQPGAASACEAVAGGYAVYCGAGNPITQAVGLGLCGPVSTEEFDRLEAFYFRRSEPVRVETCPLAHASLFEHYKERGYHATEFSNVMVRAVGDEAALWPATRPGMKIWQASPQEIELWVLTVSQGFSENYRVTDELLRVMKMFALAKGTECYLANLEGRIAGGATLAVRGRIAGLFGASTLTEFRGRGVQTALLHARLRRAQELGCELVMSLALPGSHSQRNITRVGLQTMYTRVKFERACAATGTIDRSSVSG